MTEGTIYVCCPSYGHGHKASYRQFWSKAVDPNGPYAKVNSVFDDWGCSVLADAFNTHWRTALNLQLSGTPITRFVMLHDDIVPEDFWLDKLLAELDATGADVVSAVVPIKDSRGLTSTAIDDPLDTWEVCRRLSMKEVFCLPETFSAADCGYPDRYLLPNTGCWICDFTKPWRWQVHFEITNRMAFRTEDGTFLPASAYVEGMKGAFANQSMSEDWNFGRQLGKHGAKVLVTRKVKLSHMGDVPFPNSDGSWGTWQTDKALQRKFTNVVGTDIPALEGWLTEAEGRYLATLAKNKAVLEIGSWCGLSTVWLARKASLVVAVDTFDGRGTPSPRNTYAEFLDNLERHGVKDVVRVVVGESSNALPDVEGFFDVAFIDGAHDLANLATDYALALRTLQPGGLIAFHDYHSDEHPEVTHFVDRLLAADPDICTVGQAGSILTLQPHPLGIHNGHRSPHQDGARKAARQQALTV